MSASELLQEMFMQHWFYSFQVPLLHLLLLQSAYVTAQCKRDHRKPHQHFTGINTNPDEIEEFFETISPESRQKFGPRLNGTTKSSQVGNPVICQVWKSVSENIFMYCNCYDVLLLTSSKARG